MALKKAQDACNTAQASRWDLLRGDASGRGEAPARRLPEPWVSASPPTTRRCTPASVRLFQPPPACALPVLALYLHGADCSAPFPAVPWLLLPRSAASIGRAWWVQLSHSCWRVRGSAGAPSRPTGLLHENQEEITPIAPQEHHLSQESLSEDENMSVQAGPATTASVKALISRRLCRHYVAEQVREHQPS